VRAERIEGAIRDGAVTVETVGEATGAGANCGSCRPEIARILSTLAALEVRDAA
jgi:assimilatory nitrate reductase catalytic subunit